MTPQDIEAVAQRVFDLLKPYVATHNDMAVLLRGTTDGKHPYKLTRIARTLGIK